jgi:AmmeMemoRadiSam system protein B
MRVHHSGARFCKTARAVLILRTEPSATLLAEADKMWDKGTREPSMGNSGAASLVIVWCSQLPVCRAIAVVIFCALAGLAAPPASSNERTPFAAMYLDPQPFLAAIAEERLPAPPRLRVTGISVPHHMLAADLIARGFAAAAANQYDRIIILSPDHFNRSRRPMATTRRDIDTVFGPLQNDTAASGALLEADSLFDDGDLFAQEHGIAALLPFVRHFFPDARIVPIAISYNASRADCDRAFELIKALAGPRTLVVQSTDYSHYLPADVARQRDQETLNVIAANDVDAVLRLLQPGHMDSRASQYIQMLLQGRILKGHATVIANRNSAHYSALGTRTTSYIVTVYSERPPTGAELRYQDQDIFYFGGDTYIGRFLTAPLGDKEIAATLVREVTSITGGAPLILNLEGVLLEDPPEGTGDTLHVMHASLAVPILQKLNVKVAVLANNHSSDLGSDGVKEMRAILQRAGIVPLPHGAIVDAGPFRLLGLNFIGKLDFRDFPVVRHDLDDICALQAQPPLIAFVHWGQEYTASAGAPEYAAAQSMHACGVAAIVGAHPHRSTSAIEAKQGGEYQMTYSLGNLLFDQTAKHSSGVLLELRAFKQGTFATRLIPVPNLYELGLRQLQSKQGLRINSSPQTSSAGSTAD